MLIFLFGEFLFHVIVDKNKFMLCASKKIYRITAVAHKLNKCIVPYLTVIFQEHTIKVSVNIVSGPKCIQIKSEV